MSICQWAVEIWTTFFKNLDLFKIWSCVIFVSKGIYYFDEKEGKKNPNNAVTIFIILWTTTRKFDNFKKQLLSTKSMMSKLQEDYMNVHD